MCWPGLERVVQCKLACNKKPNLNFHYHNVHHHLHTRAKITNTQTSHKHQIVRSMLVCLKSLDNFLNNFVCLALPKSISPHTRNPQCTSIHTSFTQLQHTEQQIIDDDVCECTLQVHQMKRGSIYGVVSPAYSCTCNMKKMHLHLPFVIANCGGCLFAVTFV